MRARFRERSRKRAFFILEPPLNAWHRFRQRISDLLAVKSDPQATRYVAVPARHAGVYVDHDIALTFSAVYRAIAYISQTIALLPWDVLLETSDKTRKLPNHAAWSLLRKRANPEISAFSFRETILAHALAWGNGYAEIERDLGGRPIALWPIAPNRVEPRRAESGEIVYLVWNYGAERTEIPAYDMFHLHGLGFDGLIGYSVISLAARTIGLGIASESYASDFFANGAISTGALKHPKNLSKDAQERLRENLNATIQGSGKRFNIPIFEEGMEWIDMMVKPEDAQLILTRQFQITDVARWFGLPPHKLADLMRATFSNIEEQNLEVHNDAHMPWIVRLEQEADYKLISSRERGVRTKLNPRGLLRGKDKDRAEYYKLMADYGFYTINEVRRYEDLDPIGPDGDEHIVQLNRTTLKKLVAGEPEKEAPAAEGIEPDQIEQSFQALFEEANARILRREMGQFERDKGKFEGKKGAFSAWLADFYGKNGDYMRQALEPLATSMMALIFPSAAFNGAIATRIDSFIADHAERSKTALSAHFAGISESIFPENRAHIEARELIERLLALGIGARRDQ